MAYKKGKFASPPSSFHFPLSSLSLSHSLYFLSDREDNDARKAKVSRLR
jgi:hypothetical protein